MLSQRALLGGTSAALHLLTTAAAPPLDRLVLRRYVLEWVVEEADIPGNEALALRLVGDQGIGVPAPRLLASDPDGRVTGVPLTLMTALPGAPVWQPTDRTAWLRSLAELAVRIHAARCRASWARGRPIPRRPARRPPGASTPRPG